MFVHHRGHLPGPSTGFVGTQPLQAISSITAAHVHTPGRRGARRRPDAARCGAGSAPGRPPWDLDSAVRNAIIAVGLRQHHPGVTPFVLLPEDVDVVPDSPDRPGADRSACRSGVRRSHLFARALGSLGDQVWPPRRRLQLPRRSLTSPFPWPSRTRLELKAPGCRTGRQFRQPIEPDVRGHLHAPGPPSAPFRFGDRFQTAWIVGFLALRAPTRKLPRMALLPIQPPASCSRWRSNKYAPGSAAPHLRGSGTMDRGDDRGDQSWRQLGRWWQWEAAYGAQRASEGGRIPTPLDGLLLLAHRNPEHGGRPDLLAPALSLLRRRPRSGGHLPHLSGFAGVFVERGPRPNTVIGAWVHYAGTQPAENGSPMSGLRWPVTPSGAVT